MKKLGIRLIKMCVVISGILGRATLCSPVAKPHGEPSALPKISRPTFNAGVVPAGIERGAKIGTPPGSFSPKLCCISDGRFRRKA